MTSPTLGQAKLRNNTYGVLTFTTRSLPCLTEPCPGLGTVQDQGKAYRHRVNPVRLPLQGGFLNRWNSFGKRPPFTDLFQLWYDKLRWKVSLSPFFSLKLQSVKNLPYFEVFGFLSHYCSSLPYLNSCLIKGNLHYNYRFEIRAYPVFTSVINIWYPNGALVLGQPRTKTKLVPNTIYKLLTPLAHPLLP